MCENAFETVRMYENAFRTRSTVQNVLQRIPNNYERHCERLWNVKNDVLSYLFGMRSLTVRLDLASLLKQGQWQKTVLRVTLKKFVRAKPALLRICSPRPIRTRADMRTGTDYGRNRWSLVLVRVTVSFNNMFYQVIH